MDSDSFRRGAKIKIYTEIAEDQLRQLILERPDDEWRKLYIRRTVIMSFNVLFVILCAAGIVVASVQKNELVRWVKDFSEANEWVPREVVVYAELAPQVVLGACNALIPIVSKLSTELEKWDYQNDVVNQQIWRIWFGKVLNLMIFSLV